MIMLVPPYGLLFSFIRFNYLATLRQLKESSYVTLGILNLAAVNLILFCNGNHLHTQVNSICSTKCFLK